MTHLKREITHIVIDYACLNGVMRCMLINISKQGRND